MDPGQSDWLSSFNHNGDKSACTLNNGLNIFCIIAILDESPLSTKFRTLYFSDLEGKLRVVVKKAPALVSLWTQRVMAMF